MPKYNVYMYCGSGYSLTPFYNIEADCEQQALDLAIVQAEEKGMEGLFFDDAEDSADLEVMNDEGTLMYIDATMEGANRPHYINSENLRIELADEKE